MGIFDKEKGRGIRCDPNPDGTFTCRPFLVVKGEKRATGTEQVIAVDEQCNPIFPQGINMMDEDREAIKEAVKQLTASCRKGFA